ncbi:1822_t:CDS:2, partial [Racocetra persica]
MVNQLIHLEKCDAIYKNISLHIVESVLKQVLDYMSRKIKDENQDIYRDITLSASKKTLQQVSKLGYSTVFATNSQEAVRLINSEFKILNDAYS